MWVIAAFYVFSVGWTLLSFAMVLSGTVPLSSAQQEYFASLGVLDYASSFGMGLLSALSPAYATALSPA